MNRKQLLWKGNKYFYGIDRFFQHLEEKKYKIQYRVLLSRYRGKTICPECKGSRLRKEAGYVKVAGHTIQELVSIPVGNLYDYFQNIKLNEEDAKIAERLIKEITVRLRFLIEVGLAIPDTRQALFLIIRRRIAEDKSFNIAWQQPCRLNVYT